MRFLIHACGFNLGLVMRKLVGKGPSKGLHDLFAGYLACFPAYIAGLFRAVAASDLFIASSPKFLFMREESRLAT